MLEKFVSLFVSGILSIGLLFTPAQEITQIDDQSNIGEDIEFALGSFNPAGGLTYRLQTSAGTTNDTIRLSSFKNRSDIPLTMTNLNTVIGYGTLSPQTSRSEFISFTGVTQNADGTATLTGVSRGLSDIFPFTASTTLRNAHPGQSVFILSDSPQLFDEYPIARNVEAISGVWTFSPPPEITDTATTSLQAVNKALLDATAFQGSATSTESNGGVVELGTLAEQADSFDGGSGQPTVLQTKNSTTTCQVVGSYNVVASSTTGKIDRGCIDETLQYDLSGDIVSSGGITISGELTISNSATTTSNSATTTFTNTNGVVGIGTSTPSLQSGLVVGSDTYITGGLGVGAATTTDGDLLVSGHASTSSMTISNDCTGCITYFASSDTVANGTGQQVSTQTIGFKPRIIHYVISGSDSDEEVYAWGTWTDTTSYQTMQAESAFGSPQIQGSNALTNTFTDGSLTITFTNLTSTGFDIQYNRNGTFSSEGTVRYTAIK